MLGAGTVCAQLQGAIRVATVRAVGPHLSDQMIRYLAEKAEPLLLPNAQFPDNRTATPRQIITRLCGSVRDAYVDEAARANGMETLPLDEPLGDRTSSFKWPACFYVVESEPNKKFIQVKPGDNAFTLYQTYTGGRATPVAVSKFFDVPIKELTLLKPGTKLQVPALTLTVPVVAKNGTGAQLVDGLKALDQGSALTETASVEGDIVVGVTDGATAAAPSCVESTFPPFNPEAVSEAYKFSKGMAGQENINVAGGQVELVVVDNGFFGAKANPQGTNPFEGSPFNRKFFKTHNEHTIATALILGSTAWPINYANNIEPTMESGHGTHVTGLVLGGPYFKPYVEGISKDPWASVTILNVGLGKRTLFKGAYGVFMTQLRTDAAPRIVNLSIVHDGLTDKQVGLAYRNLFNTLPNTLFVAAAGNNGGKDVRARGIFPATYGGDHLLNVITVAALGAGDRLAPFSNRSSRAVDLAAPGCRISSWIAHDKEPVPMSGTSQAAPLVTFNATLLRSIAVRANPATLKNRIISSGDLLPESERGATAFDVKLNIQRSLLMFQDAIEVVDNGSPRRLLGTLLNVTPMKCLEGSTKSEKSREDMWSLKRSQGGSFLLFAGMLSGRVERPCQLVVEEGANIFFSATHEIGADEKIQAIPKDDRNWPLTALQNLVVATPLTDLR